MDTLFFNIGRDKAEVPVNAISVAIGNVHVGYLDIENNMWIRGNRFTANSNFSEKDDYGFRKIIGHKAKHFVLGYAAIMFISMDDTVYYGGVRVSKGVLPRNRDDESLRIQQLYDSDNHLIRAKDISLNENHAVILSLEGNVYTFGIGLSGALGLGNKQTYSNPQLVPGLTAVQVAAGYSYTSALGSDGTVYIAGTNDLGCLGIGMEEEIVVTRFIVPFPFIKAQSLARLSLNSTSMGIIDLNNDIWVWGFRQYRSIISSPYRIGLKGKFLATTGHLAYIIDRTDKLWRFESHSIVKASSQIDYKVKYVLCRRFDTVILGRFSGNLSFGDNVYLKYFNDIINMLHKGEILRFDFQREYQELPHNDNNLIASFYGVTGDIYLVELQYDQNNNTILPPQ